VRLTLRKKSDAASFDIKCFFWSVETDRSPKYKEQLVFALMDVRWGL
jgi:hypothetical protein